MVIFDNEKPKPEMVPNRHPYGSITDGDWVCARCREPITGCSLCAGEIRHIVPVNKRY